MSAMLEVTVLGCGASGGVPGADGDWGVCDPTNPKNLRKRCSLLVRRRGQGEAPQTTVMVDASPEFRLQTGKAGVKRLDALLLSHDHADQVNGLDDVRAFFIRQRARIPCWMDEATDRTMMRRFGYIFEGEGGLPSDLQPPHPTKPWKDLVDRWALQRHPDRHLRPGPWGVRSVGYRFGRMAYSSDVVGLDEAVFAALEDLDVWIVDALRRTPHPTHSHLERTLEWIARVKPRRAILTNMHIDLDYDALVAELPQGVEPAYDGLRFEHEISD